MEPEARKVSNWASKLRTLQRDTSSAMVLPRGEIISAWTDSTASRRLESWALACATGTSAMVVGHFDDQHSGVGTMLLTLVLGRLGVEGHLPQPGAEPA
jgi:hypothetical protein